MFETLGVTMPKAKTKSKASGRAINKAWADMAKKFLSKLDSEQHEHADGSHGSERDCAGQVIHHFIAWVGDRSHHYQDDGYLVPFVQKNRTTKRH
jgi:hypothetical protein